MFFLKEIDDGFKNEILNPNPLLRKQSLSGLEGLLQAALASLEQAKVARLNKVATPGAGPGRVQQLVKFHETQQANTVAVDNLAEKIIRIRIWLHRQGARLSREGKIIWRKSDARLVYDGELAQVMTLVRIQGGRFMTIERKPLDTREMVTRFSGPGWGIWVMSAEGNLHVASHSVGARHHSSLLAGAPVACAGELVVHDGRLVKINNKSGHYTPEPFYLSQTVRHFATQGIPLDSYPVSTFEGQFGRIRREFTTARAFLDSMVVPFIPKVVAQPGPKPGLRPPSAAPRNPNPYAYAGNAAADGQGYELYPNPRYRDPDGGAPLQGEYVDYIPGV